jgi:nucleoporin NDC1
MPAKRSPAQVTSFHNRRRISGAWTVQVSRRVAPEHPKAPKIFLFTSVVAHFQANSTPRIGNNPRDYSTPRTLGPVLRESRQQGIQRLLYPHPSSSSHVIAPKRTMTVIRRAPYKDFLQPCMQRRFASALLVLLALSYLESLTLSSWNSIIWSWFPIGIAGIRTLFIFGSVLLVVILRIAHPHIGLRTSNSPFDTFQQNIFSLSAYETIVTYAISAFLFSQVYLGSVADRSNLHWITYHSGDRARLNERTLFYTVSMISIGVAAGFLHLFFDVDRVLLGTVKETEEKPKQEDPYEKLLSKGPSLLVRSFTISAIVATASYMGLYSFCFRHTAWGWAMFFLRPFYNLPKTNIPPAGAPWSIWMLGRTIAAGTLLNVLWQFSNEAFTVNFAKAPVKNGQPITSESKDPNGSLLNGLKNKKTRISVCFDDSCQLRLYANDCSLLPCGN